MPRIADIHTEETAAASHVRRSTRVASASIPSSVKTRRASLLVQENEDVKTSPKTRRGRCFCNYKNLIL